MHIHNPKQQLAVISGASSGIGAATARALAHQGWRVVLIARNLKALEKLADHLPKDLAIVMAVDASDGDAVLRAAEKILLHHGTPDVLIHCAGAGTWRFVEETPPEEIRQMMDAPFMAAFHLNHAFMLPMIERGSGLLIHINSPVSELGWPGATGYMAARFALRGLHEALRMDLHGTGVKSSHIVFSKVKSDYFINNPGSEDRLPAIARMVPELTPEQCAQVILSVIRRPRAQVIYPMMLKIFYGLNKITPGLVRWLAIQTGRRH
jgi:NADP-dependent 3-hydroxy acid dehydrogenase YdfG